MKKTRNICTHRDRRIYILSVIHRIDCVNLKFGQWSRRLSFSPDDKQNPVGSFPNPAAAIFRNGFLRMLKLTREEVQVGSYKKCNSVSCSTAGGRELAYEKSSGIVAFELLRRTPGPASENLRVGVGGVIAVDH